MLWRKKPCIRLVAAAVFLATALAGMPATAAPSFLVDAEWLEGIINDPKLVILEVRYHPHRYYTIGHIPGAINIVSQYGTDPGLW